MSQFDTRANPFAGLPRPQSGGQQLGYQFTPRGIQQHAVAGGGGRPRGLAPQSRGVGGVDQLFGALKHDIGFLQNEVVAPYQEALAEMRNAVPQGAQAIRDANARGVDVLDRMLAESDPRLLRPTDTSGLDALMRETSGRLDKTIAGAERTYSQTAAGVQDVIEGVDRTVGGAIAKALQFASDAVGSAAGAVQGYDASAHNIVRSYVSGFERRTESQLRLIEAGLNPETGMPMSASEQAAMRSQMVEQTNAEIGRNVLAYRDQAQQFLAQLQTNLANVQLGAAGVATEAGKIGLAGEQTKLDAVGLREQAAGRLDQTRLAAEELRARTGVETEQGKINAALADQQARLQAQSLRNDVANSMTTLMSTGEMQAVSFQVQGLSQYAELVKGTPYVSLFEGLMSIFNLISAPGGRNLPALNL